MMEPEPEPEPQPRPQPAKGWGAVRAAKQVAAARPDHRGWEELSDSAPSALKWIMKSQLVLTCPASLEGVEANGRPRSSSRDGAAAMELQITTEIAVPPEGAGV